MFQKMKCANDCVHELIDEKTGKVYCIGACNCGASWYNQNWDILDPDGKNGEQEYSLEILIVKDPNFSREELI